MSIKYPIKIIEQFGSKVIWDGVRKKYVKCTPEEIVRQELIQFLIENCNFPKACFSVEKRIKVGTRFLRYDIIVYKNANPWLLVECKAPQFEIDPKIFMQSLVYQQNAQAKYILLCNGLKTICMDIENKEWIAQIPAY